MRFLDLKSGWRQLVQDPAYAVFSIGGLSLALASVLLLSAFMEVTLRGDREVPEIARVMRLEGRINLPGADEDWQPGTVPPPIQDLWKSSGAPVEATTRYVEEEMSLRVGSRLVKQSVGFVDPQAVQVFGLKSVSGDITAALTRPNTMAISVETARRLFGRTDVLGERIDIEGKGYSVAALMTERAAGSVLKAQILVSIVSPAMPTSRINMTWSGVRPQTFVRLAAAGTPDNVADHARALFEASPQYKAIPPIYRSGPRPLWEPRGVMLSDVPLSGAGNGGTRTLIGALSLATALILVLAAINFANLCTVRTLRRQREIGMRKALGAGPMRVIGQFVTESFLAVMLAATAALLIAVLLAPWLGEMLQVRLAEGVLEPRALLLALPVVLLLGVSTGAYPAWVALRMNCAQSLVGRGHVEGRYGVWVRRTLTAVQTAAALGLLVVTLVVWWQSRHLMGATPGYDPAPLLYVQTPVDYTDPRLPAFQEAVSRLPGVEAVGLSWDIIGRGKYVTTTDINSVQGEPKTLSQQYVGAGTLQTYGIRPLAGRLFEQGRDPHGEGMLVLNELALPLLGFRSPADAVGKQVTWGDTPVEIIGVIPAIRERGLRQASRPVVYSIDSPRVTYLTVRAHDAAQVKEGLRTVWSQFFPDNVVQIGSVRAALDEQVAQERRLAALVGVASVVTLLLAGFGVYTLAAHTVQRRTREIVIRKLYGASGRDIALLLWREFGAIVGAGVVIGLPLAWWASQRYLEGFVERAPLGQWPAALLALFAVTVVTLLAMFRHTSVAVRMPPRRVLGS